MRRLDRNLTLGMKGPDVAAFQQELRRLGLAIPDAEIATRSFAEGTLKAVREFQARTGQATGVVDEATVSQLAKALAGQQPQVQSNDQPKPLIVRGQIRQTDGSRLVGGLVRASDRDLRSSQELGSSQWDAEGRFEITYTTDKFARAEKGSADLTFQIEN